MYTGFGESLKRMDNLVDLSVDEMIILKKITEIGCDRVDRILWTRG
jgi:hypothetical protein